jgi:hypothetical protein
MDGNKPLGQKAYGSIPHLRGSRRGPSDKGVNDGQHRICCERRRDKNDLIVVQEKLDGSNVAVAKIDGEIVPLIRAGYPAVSSHYEQHRLFAEWVFERQGSFDALLENGERLVGEWLAQAHGTRYDLSGRSPFVAFDLMMGIAREPYERFVDKTEWCVDTHLFDIPPLLHMGDSLPIEEALKFAGPTGRYGALDPVEGVVYRVERYGRNGTKCVDFLAKYVRPEKVDGCYLTELSGHPPHWNWRPNQQSVTHTQRICTRKGGER